MCDNVISFNEKAGAIRKRVYIQSLQDVIDSDNQRVVDAAIELLEENGYYVIKQDGDN